MLSTPSLFASASANALRTASGAGCTATIPTKLRLPAAQVQRQSRTSHRSSVSVRRGKENSSRGHCGRPAALREFQRAQAHRRVVGIQADTKPHLAGQLQHRRVDRQHIANHRCKPALARQGDQRRHQCSAEAPRSAYCAFNCDRQKCSWRLRRSDTPRCPQYRTRRWRARSPRRPALPAEMTREPCAASRTLSSRTDRMKRM